MTISRGIVWNFFLHIFILSTFFWQQQNVDHFNVRVLILSSYIQQERE